MADLYESENALCMAMVEYALAEGWRVFPETSQCDLLLVATDKVRAGGVKPGDQVGIQAKLRDNLEVLHQAMPRAHASVGPDYHAVLVVKARHHFVEVANSLSIVVLQGTRVRGNKLVADVRGSLSGLPLQKKQYYSDRLWHPEREIWTPPGVKSPGSISPWKESAVRLCLESLKRGYLTSQHFRQSKIKMDMRRWVENKWVIDTGEKQGRLHKYVINEKGNPPHLMYPEAAKQIAKDVNDVNQT